MKTSLIVGIIIGIGIVLVASGFFYQETYNKNCIKENGKVTGFLRCTVTFEDFAEPELNYSKLLIGADKNIDIAHHIDMIPINSTKHAFSIKSINLNSDETITINFGGVSNKFAMIPEFNYTRIFQVNDSFIFYCMPRESGYPSMGVYKYLGTQMKDGNLNYVFYHGDAMSQNEFECVYPEIIKQSVNIFDIQLTPEMLQRYEIRLPLDSDSGWITGEDYCSVWCDQKELYNLGCDDPILQHLVKYSNLLDEEFDGVYGIEDIGLPDGVSKEKFEECVQIIYEMRLPSHANLNISKVRVENFCTEKPWICYGTFDNGTEIRIACDFPMHGCMKSFDKDNYTKLENEN